MADHLLVVALDGDARCCARGQGDPPQALLAPDHAVGRDVGAGRQVAVLRPGARVQAAQQLHGFLGLLALAVQFVAEAVDADLRQARQCACGHGHRQFASRRVRRQRAQLQAQALAKVACADADRIELLDAMQHLQ